VWAQNGDVLGSLQLTATGQAAALWYDWLMPQRKNAQAKTPVKPSHRHVRAGFARLRENRYAEAKKAFQRALTLAQGTDEFDGEDVARIEHLIGLCLRELGHLSAARAHFARASEQAEMFYGANHRALIPICVDLGDAMGAAGDLREAKALYERAVAIDPEAPTVASTLCGLGRVLEHLGDWRGAKARYEQALALAETQDGPERDALALACMHLGNLLLLLEDRTGGVGYLKRGAAVGKVAFEKEFPEAAATMSRMEMALDGGAVISRAVH
jgi:tetratricopeptide (TPR) repeat protein